MTASPRTLAAGAEWLESSATYHADITKLRAGDIVEVPVSHSLQPEEADRLLIVVRNSMLKQRWSIRPVIVSSDGELRGPVVTVELPQKAEASSH